MAQPTASQPATPRLASTVLVLRDAKGVEVLLVERHAALRFMGGMHVFPGGAVQAGDSDPRLLRRISARPTPWPTPLAEALELGYAAAAVRETFEEAGLLLGVAADSAPAAVEGLRSRALAGAELLELLDSAELDVDLSVLTPLVRWITPASEPIRFDTRFYIARAPQGQQARHDARESVSLAWRSLRGAIDDAQRGVLKLSPPTLLTLREISGATQVEDVFERAQRWGVPTIEPVIREVNGQRQLLYPGDPEHPARTKALSGPTRRPFPR